MRLNENPKPHAEYAHFEILVELNDDAGDCYQESTLERAIETARGVARREVNNEDTRQLRVEVRGVPHDPDDEDLLEGGRDLFVIRLEVYG